MVLAVYRDLNVCYHGRQKKKKKKLIRIKVAIIFTDDTDFDTEHKCTSAS